MPEWLLELTLSDYLLGVGAAAIAWFVIDYGVFTPWWRRAHGFIGYIILLFMLSLTGLLFLIIWGVVVGQRVEEWVRIPVTALVAIGAISKIVILHHERHAGTIESRTPSTHKERQK